MTASSSPIDRGSAATRPWAAAHYRDIAWASDSPTRQLLPIAGVAFYNEKVDITPDGTLLLRPVTTFS